MKTVLLSCTLLLISVAVISVFAQQKAKNAAPKAPRYLHSSASDWEGAVDTDWMTPGYKVPDIAPEIFIVPSVTVDSPFRPAAVLFKLFPGRHYYLVDEPGKGYGVAIWSSVHFPSEKMDDGEWFPGMQRHVTVVKQVVPYRDDSGLAHVIVSFESNDLNAMDELHLGRFFGADMSLALFTYRGTQWVLDNFS